MLLLWYGTNLRFEIRQIITDCIPQSLEHCLAAGEALNSEVFRQWKQISNLNIHDGYGQTETILLCGNCKDCPIRPATMGKPAPGIPLNVIDVDGRENVPQVKKAISPWRSGRQTNLRRSSVSLTATLTKMAAFRGQSTNLL